MDIQNIIAGMIMIAALLSGAVFIIRKIKAFRPGPGCADDCGCSSGSKNTAQ